MTNRPKFEIGELVRAESDVCPATVFTIGFISEGVHEDGTPFFWYTENKTDTPPYYTEAILSRVEGGN
jgi:hypothetical protein